MVYATNKTVSIVCDKIQSKADNNNGILVIAVTGDNWATVGISTTVTGWIKTNI